MHVTSRSFVSLVITASLCFTSGMVFAADQSAVLPVHVVLSTGQVKELHLPKVPLSPEQRTAFATQHKMLMQWHPLTRKKSSLPSEVNVGMGNIPVFDQGAWGTCATFASTAGVDALLQLAGDEQVSQLCNLQLGRTLELPDVDGGWEGSFGYVVLGQLDHYGYLPMTYQRSQGCGGLTEYPAFSPDNGSPMPLSDFESQSVKQFTHDDWVTVLPFNRRFRPLNPAKGEIVLEQVKQHLVSGHRVLIGTILDASKGDAGSYGRFHNARDAVWVLTDTILNNIIHRNGVAGHELLIIGYSDQACATYINEQQQVRQQCGLLRLRNSWSVLAGDRGDYYMSYDYFKTMVVEAYALGKGVRPPEPGPTA